MSGKATNKIDVSRNVANTARPLSSKVRQAIFSSSTWVSAEFTTRQLSIVANFEGKICGNHNDSLGHDYLFGGCQTDRGRVIHQSTGMRLESSSDVQRKRK